MSVCLSVQTITFKPLHIGTSFLVWRYILTISRVKFEYQGHQVKFKVMCKKFLCMWLQAIHKVKVTYQGQGQIKVKDQIEFIFKERYSYAGGLHLNQMRSCFDSIR